MSERTIVCFPVHLVFDKLEDKDLPIYAYLPPGSLASGTYIELEQPRSIRGARSRVLRLAEEFRFGTVVVPWRWAKIDDFSRMIELTGFRIRRRLDCPVSHPSWFLDLTNVLGVQEIMKS